LFNSQINYQKLLDNPNISSKAKNYITLATGLTPIIRNSSSNNIPTNSVFYKGPSGNNGVEVKFNANADTNSLGDMDIINDLPKLTEKQIKAIISKHYNKSTVIKPDDAQAIYNAQNKSGISALVTLGVGALESGWGTSNIANKTRNLWGYGATNDNPEGNAHKYSTMEDAALRYSESLKKDYYDGYGAKTINSIGTGNNPAGKGYAYNNDGSISTTWSPTVTSIMKTLYNTAKAV
jgi:beta-N-acetylglucosaminidase